MDGGQPRTAYRAEIHPWLWFLTRTTDCRIFQDKSVPDIVKEVFDDLRLLRFKVELTGTYACEVLRAVPRDRFNFVSRLLEEEGIYYYFQHEDGKHTLVLSATTARATRCCPVSRRRAPRGAAEQLGAR